MCKNCKLKELFERYKVTSLQELVDYIEEQKAVIDNIKKQKALADKDSRS